MSFGQLSMAPVAKCGLVVQQVFQIIAEIRAQGTTVLLVEQNAHMALSIGDRGYVLETGRLVAEGNPKALWNNGGSLTIIPSEASLASLQSLTARSVS
jgi:ABC-type branched-subunit amino acid transport system ATPase component